MSILDQINQHARQGGLGCVQPQMKPITPHKPSMGAKLSKVAEIFELDIIDADEALKACKVIIEQHTKIGGVADLDDAAAVK